LPETDALPHFVRGFTALAADAFDDALRHYGTGLACNPPNPALCSDTLELVDAVEQLQRRERVRRRTKRWHNTSCWWHGRMDM
jgi:hypothetical protein